MLTMLIMKRTHEPKCVISWYFSHCKCKEIKSTSYNSSLYGQCYKPILPTWTWNGLKKWCFIAIKYCYINTCRRDFHIWNNDIRLMKDNRWEIENCVNYSSACPVGLKREGSVLLEWTQRSTKVFDQWKVFYLSYSVILIIRRPWECSLLEWLLTLFLILLGNHCPIHLFLLNNYYVQLCRYECFIS